MDFRMDFVPSETVLRWVAEDAFRLHPDDNRLVIDSEYACTTIEKIVEGSAPPMCVVVDSEGCIADGAREIACLVGAMLTPPDRPDWNLPDFFEDMKVAGLNLSAGLCVSTWAADTPLWLPTQAVVETMPWLSWLQSLDRISGVSPAEIERTKTRAVATARTLLDFRVIVVRADRRSDSAGIRDEMKRRRRGQ